MALSGGWDRGYSRRACLALLAAAGLVAVAAWGLGAVDGMRGGSDQFQAPGSIYERANALYRRISGQRGYFGVNVLLQPDADVERRAQAGWAAGRVGAVLAAQHGFERLADATSGGRRHEMLVMAAFATPADSAAAVARLHAVVSSGRGRGRGRLGGWRVAAGGPDIAFSALQARTLGDVERVEVFALPLLALLCFCVFGGLGFLLPMILGACAIVVALVVLRLLELAGVPVSVYCLPAVIGLGSGLGIDYTLLILFRYREEIDRGAKPSQAMRQTLATAGRTVLIRAVTIAALLATLRLLPLPFLSSIGLAAGVTALAAGATAWLLLPRLLGLLGRRLGTAPSIIRRHAGRQASRHTWQRLASWVTAHPTPAAMSAGVLLLAFAAPVAGLRLVAPNARLLPPGVESRQVEHALAKDFTADPAAAMYTIYTPALTGPTVKQLAARQAQIAGRQAEVLPARYLGSGAWEISVLPHGAPDSPANQRLLARLRVVTPASALTGGFTAFTVDQKNAISAHLPITLAILAILSGAALFTLSGSVVIAVKGILMATLSVAAGIGLLVATLGGLEEANLLFMVAIALALSIDYELFLISRMTEERNHGLPNQQAIATGLARTGPLITAAALLFCVAVAGFSSSPVLNIRQFGLGAALTVAIDASLVRSLLAPSLMVLLGERNWWAPAPLRRVHDKIGYHSRQASPCKVLPDAGGAP